MGEISEQCKAAIAASWQRKCLLEMYWAGRTMLGAYHASVIPANVIASKGFCHLVQVTDSLRLF